MKTIGDLERWLRNAAVNKKLYLIFDTRTGHYEAIMSGIGGASKNSLEAAIDNLTEELRRVDSGSKPMRDKPAPSTAVNVTWTLNGSSMTPKPTTTANPTLPSISQAAQQAYQQQAATQYPTCPKCSMFSIASMPNVNGSGNAHICVYGHTWSTP